jgi:multicomponent Na+:H+ antiporter subunit D
MASAGTFLHTGLKLPYFTFLGKDVGLRPREAPWNMLLAMGISAFFCVFIGVHPAWLYAFMPTPVEYNAYSAGHLFWELQLLLFTGLGFFLMLKHLGGEPKLSVDTDWVYRKAGPALVRWSGGLVRQVWRGLIVQLLAALDRMRLAVQRWTGGDGALGRVWSIGPTTVWTVLIVAVFGLVYLMA